jgi:hypothetical protein
MELSKDKRRAVRRKRDFIAKSMKENRLYHQKTVEPRRTRQKINLREIENEDFDRDNTHEHLQGMPELGASEELNIDKRTLLEVQKQRPFNREVRKP